MTQQAKAGSRIAAGAVVFLSYCANRHRGMDTMQAAPAAEQLGLGQTAHKQRPQKSTLTASSSFWVSSSILLMSSIVRSIHLSIQQNSWRWKLVNILFSCFKKKKTHVRQRSAFCQRLGKRLQLLSQKVTICRHTLFCTATFSPLALPDPVESHLIPHML